jgi:hypothetical protein
MNSSNGGTKYKGQPHHRRGCADRENSEIGYLECLGPVPKRPVVEKFVQTKIDLTLRLGAKRVPNEKLALCKRISQPSGWMHHDEITLKILLAMAGGATSLEDILNG